MENITLWNMISLYNINQKSLSVSHGVVVSSGWMFSICGRGLGEGIGLINLWKYIKMRLSRSFRFSGSSSWSWGAEEKCFRYRTFRLKSRGTLPSGGQLMQQHQTGRIARTANSKHCHTQHRTRIQLINMSSVHTFLWASCWSFTGARQV